MPCDPTSSKMWYVALHVHSWKFISSSAPYQECHPVSPAPWHAHLTPSGPPTPSQSLQGLRHGGRKYRAFHELSEKTANRYFSCSSHRMVPSPSHSLDFQNQNPQGVQASSRKFVRKYPKISAHPNPQVEVSFSSWMRTGWAARPHVGWGKARGQHYPHWQAFGTGHKGVRRPDTRPQSAFSVQGQ